MVDAASLTLGEGLEVLLSRKLDRLSPGELLEVHSDDPSIEHDLRAWARFTANEWKGMRVENGRFVCSIRRGTAQRIITTDPSTWLEAKRETGFAPRGAIVEKGSPEFPFDVLRAEEASNPEARELYERAISSQKHAIDSDSSFRKKLAVAAQERASALAEVRTVNPLVEESLIVLAAGGLNPLALPKAVRAVRGLYDTMHENRIKWLQLIGFSSGESEALSQSHTPNFM